MPASTGGSGWSGQHPDIARDRGEVHLMRKGLRSFRPDRLRYRLGRVAEDAPSYFSLKTLAYSLSRHGGLELGTDNELPEGELCRILFVGDTSFAESYGKAQVRLLAEKGYDYPLAKMKPLLERADLVICNLETPMTDIERSPYDGMKSYVHWTHVGESPRALKRNNMATFSLANNHALDYGIPGLEQTLEAMKEHGLTWFGAGMNEDEASQPLLKTLQMGERELRVAVIGVLQRYREYEKVYDYYARDGKGGCYMLSAQSLRRQIRELKARDPGTYVIVFPHWGANYRWRSFHQTSNAHRMIRYGADLVIGHGAHGIQEIEKHRGRWILYGIGNFAFLSEGRFEDLSYPPYSCAAELVLADNGGKLEKRLRLYPIHSDNTKTAFQPRPLTDDEADNFVSIMLERSPLLPREPSPRRRPAVLAGWAVRRPARSRPPLRLFPPRLLLRLHPPSPLEG